MAPVITPVARLARAALTLATLAGPTEAMAASFSCAKAATPVEKTICADPGLSKLDERLAAAFKEAMQRLAGSSPDGTEIQALVKADQKAWLAERNACGADAGCLHASYERRVAVLSFRPDPGARSPADPYIGRFDHRGFMEVAALGLRDGTLAVSASGAEPTAGRWTCDFAGIGRINTSGALMVGTPGAEGNGLLLERNGAAGVRIADTPANQAASGMWCGMNGSFVFDYARKK